MSMTPKKSSLPVPSTVMVWQEFIEATGIAPERLQELLGLGWIEVRTSAAHISSGRRSARGLRPIRSSSPDVGRASMGAIVGASLSGMKSFTATSGPGFSLMQENLGMATMGEVPVVVVNVQRSGPSTGLATKPAQSDIMQLRWGRHGTQS